jgi:triacylglycerol lipase
VPHRVYLVPGFFGFANLGRIRYFGPLREVLARRLAARGVHAAIHVVRTPPTASLPVRAARLVETIAATARGRDVVHVVGHSSGGLDARLALAPGVELPTRVRVEPIARRVRSLVTVATPHRGTPIAGLFATLRGQRLLQLVSLATIRTLHAGGLPLALGLELAGVIARAEGGALRSRSAILDALVEQLLADFSQAPRRAMQRLLASVARDQALLVQLTPEAMGVFAAAVRDRPGVRHGCVVTLAARYGLRSTVAAGLDPAAQASHAVFGALQRLAARPPAVPVSRDAARELRRAFGRLPLATENDGVVPTRSQPFGRIVHAARADHLDVLGHFRSAAGGGPPGRARGRSPASLQPGRRSADA